MPLQLWTGKNGHWFVDTELGGVQVGQVYQNPVGTWAVEVNEHTLEAPDLETAIGIFVTKYDQSLVHLSPGSGFDEVNEADFTIIEL
jgi:hypothetical protein